MPIAETTVNIDLAAGIGANGRLSYALHVEISVDLDQMTWDWTLIGLRSYDGDGQLDEATLRDHGAVAMAHWSSRLADLHPRIEAAIVNRLKTRIERT